MLRYQDSNGVTALHCASYRDFLFYFCKDVPYPIYHFVPHAILRSMFNNINTKDIDLQSILAITDKNGYIPLHWAAQYASVDVVKLMVQYSPPSALTTKTRSGKTPLDIARLCKKTDNVKFLEDVSNIDMQYIIIET